MSEALLTQHIVAQVLGASRLQRLLRAGWLAPRERTPSRVLFSPRDLHAALQRLEREACPLDRIEVARVRTSEERNGHPRVRKEKPLKSLDLSAIKLDFSAIPEGPEVYD
jgi:hypothetical protein